MEVFAHRVSAAQAVCTVVHVLLAPRPGKAWAAQAVKAVHDWNTSGKSYSTSALHNLCWCSTYVQMMGIKHNQPTVISFLYLFPFVRTLPLPANRSNSLWAESLSALHPPPPPLPSFSWALASNKGPLAIPFHSWRHTLRGRGPAPAPFSAQSLYSDGTNVPIPFRRR